MNTEEHELSSDCWCEPEVVSYDDGKSWQDYANEALDADEAYLESLPPQLRFVCADCGRPPMAAAKRLREQNDG
jgi:hypothetical protein